MTKKISKETEILIRTLSDTGYSRKEIKEKLNVLKITLSIRTISRVINYKGKERRAKLSGQIFKRKRKRLVRTKKFIRQIKNEITKENPKSQRNLAILYKTSAKTINKTIKEDLSMKAMKKGKVHSLNKEQMKNRKKNSRKLYENYLAGDKWKYCVTIDEAFFYLNNSYHQSDICYVNKEKNESILWSRTKTETFSKKLMIVGIMCGKKVLPLIKVPIKTKINSSYYIKYVLKPLVEKHLPFIYGNNLSKVYIHHDKATSHTSTQTLNYMLEAQKKYKVKFIEKKDIVVKGPDVSPLDFYGFGYLKQRLSKRRPRTLNGIWKVLNQEWNKITPLEISRVFASWKRRCRIVAKKNGEQIEHLKLIHKRSPGRNF